MKPQSRILITDLYREQNRLLHTSNPGFGAGSSKWVRMVINMAKACGAKTVLDYGCGKGTLVQVLNNGNSSGLRVFGYDPAVEQYAKEPEPADFVVCTDVLEHVEPECIRDVLEHIASLALKAFWAYITTSPSNKMLPCGKNAHILQRDKDWWARELRVSFPGGHFVPGYSMNRIMFWWCKKEAYKKYRRTEQMEQRA